MEIGWRNEKGGFYIASKDIAFFPRGQKDLLYNTKVYPQPWWGNIVNPKIVVLSLNPSYDEGADELDNAVFRNILEENLENPVSLFGNKFKNEYDVPFKYSSVSEWWRNVFSEIIPNDLLEDSDEINLFNENVGIFNLDGYHSKNVDKLNSHLSTSKKMVEYINSLAQCENRLFIFVWGKGTWDKRGLKVTSNFIEVNKSHKNCIINPRNKMLKNKINNVKDKEKLKDILINLNLTKENFVEIVEFYKTISKNRGCKKT